jgi:hypothetical protein
MPRTVTTLQQCGRWSGLHLDELYEAGSFRIDPDYDKEKVVGLSHDVAETYVPVNITVAYGGQTPVPNPAGRMAHGDRHRTADPAGADRSRMMLCRLETDRSDASRR